MSRCLKGLRNRKKLNRTQERLSGSNIFSIQFYLPDFRDNANLV